MDNDIIDGEVVESDRQVATHSDNATGMRVFNPLDAEPIAFKRALESRQENYNSLAQHLRTIMTPGIDFGRIHHDKNCKDGQWKCTNPRHWTPYDLWSPGADKILGVLNLGVNYPGVEAYKKAALSGVKVEDVIVDCHIDNAEQTIAEGLGACSRSEGQIKGDLNRCIKRACKRARVDAVKRLPTVASLFEDQAFWAKLEADHKASKKQQFHNSPQRFSSGAYLTHWPFQKPPKMKGVRFDEMPDHTIDWILGNMADKPDIFKAAQRVKEARHPDTPPKQTGNGASTGDSQPRDELPKEDEARAGKEEPAPPGDKGPLTQADPDWLKEYEDADVWQSQ